MPDLNLPLEVKPIDTATPVNDYANNVMADNTRVLQQKELQAQIAQTQFAHMNEVSQANLKGMIVGGALIKPYLDSGNVAGAQAILGRMSSDPIMGKNASLMSQMIQSGNVKDLQAHVDDLTSAGKVLGLITPDIKSVAPGETLIDVNTGKPVASQSLWGGLDTGATPSANPPALPALGAGQGAAGGQPATGSGSLSSSAPPAAAPQGAAQSAAPAQNQNIAPAVAQAASGPRDDNYLAQLPPQAQTIVKGLANYDLDPKAIPARNPQLKLQILAAVKQYAPSWNENGYNTVQEFTRGKTSQNIKSIETALNTLAQTKTASDTLGGVDHAWILNSPINHLINMYNGAENNPDLNTYNTLAKNAADETTTAVTGGKGGVEDRATRASGFAAGQSPSSRNAALNASVQELMSRLDPVVEQFNNGTTSNISGLDLLSPKARAAYQKLMGKAPEGYHAGVGGEPAQAAPDAQGWQTTEGGTKYRVVQ